MLKDTDPRHTCKHQVLALLRCAVPSCPDSPRGKVYKVKITVPHGHALAHFERIRTAAGWTWRPLFRETP